MKCFFPVILIFLIQVDMTGQVPVPSKSDAATSPEITLNRQTKEPGDEQVKELYFKSVASPNEIINGKEYLSYFFRSKNTPLLFSNLAFYADLTINDRTYSNVKLQYDTFLDEVVYTDTSKIINFEFPRIALNKELVSGFRFRYDGEIYNFTNFSFPAGSKNSPGDGFYDLVYDGPSKFIVRHRSIQYVKDAVNEYKYSPVKYIYIDGTFRRFTNRKDFISLFGPGKEDILKYLHENKMKIRKAGKTEIVQLLKHYDSSVH